MRVITADGEYVGVLSKDEALKEANKRDLDLVEISPNANPPVCKIIDHGKYKYRQQKKEQKQSQKSHQPELKTLKLSFSISDHDMQIRAKSAKKFLSRGDRVRVVLPLRGRENALKDTAKEKMRKYVEMIKEDLDIEIEKEIKKEPRGLTMTLTKN
jgi:translation initiation factor IF-3